MFLRVRYLCAIVIIDANLYCPDLTRNRAKNNSFLKPREYYKLRLSPRSNGKLNRNNRVLYFMHEYIVDQYEQHSTLFSPTIFSCKYFYIFRYILIYRCNALSVMYYIFFFLIYYRARNVTRVVIQYSAPNVQNLFALLRLMSTINIIVYIVALRHTDTSDPSR